MSAGEDLDELVIVTRVRDPVRAELIRELLEDEKIHVSIPGAMHRGMLGIEGGFLELPVLVPRRDREDAEALIDAMENHDGLVSAADDETLGTPDVGAGDPRPSDDAPGTASYRAPARKSTSPTPPSPRLRRIAGFVAIAMTFGAGHWYARETTSGLLLSLAQLVALVVSMTVYPWAMIALIVLVIYDFIGSMRASVRFNEGRKLSGGQQATRTFGAIALSVAVALALIPVAARIDARHRAEEAAQARAAHRRWLHDMGLRESYEQQERFDPDEQTRSLDPSRPFRFPDFPLDPPPSEQP